VPEDPPREDFRNVEERNVVGITGSNFISRKAPRGFETHVIELINDSLHSDEEQEQYKRRGYAHFQYFQKVLLHQHLYHFQRLSLVKVKVKAKVILNVGLFTHGVSNWLQMYVRIFAHSIVCALRIHLENTFFELILVILTFFFFSYLKTPVLYLGAHLR